MKKNFLLGTFIFLFLFLIDYVYTLFKIKSSGIYYSFFGIKYDMIMDEKALETAFSLTIKCLYSYLIFISLFILITFILKKKSHKKTEK